MTASEIILGLLKELPGYGPNKIILTDPKGNILFQNKVDFMKNNLPSNLATKDFVTTEVTKYQYWFDGLEGDGTEKSPFHFPTK